MWTAEERKLLCALDSPIKVQTFLDEIPYNTDSICRSPRGVMQYRKAHCADGALFAYTALLDHENVGIVDLCAVRDDDHLITTYRRGEYWGAVAKSNTSILRFREPVYRSLRELVMSYFDVYMNSNGERTLRKYSRPIKPKPGNWMFTADDLDPFVTSFDSARHYQILTPGMIRKLHRADQRLIDATLLGSDPKGTYDPRG